MIDKRPTRVLLHDRNLPMLTIRMFIPLFQHRCLHPCFLRGMYHFGNRVATFHGGEVGKNIKHQSCWVSLCPPLIERPPSGHGSPVRRGVTEGGSGYWTYWHLRRGDMSGTNVRTFVDVWTNWAFVDISFCRCVLSCLMNKAGQFLLDLLISPVKEK